MNRLALPEELELFRYKIPLHTRFVKGYGSSNKILK